MYCRKVIFIQKGIMPQLQKSSMTKVETLKKTPKSKIVLDLDEYIFKDEKIKYHSER